MHTLFNRELNRIAKELSQLQPTWGDAKLFFETRRIVIAEIQHIVYNEWLPIISELSRLAENIYFDAMGYDSEINPALTNEFATAAFRMGHSLIRDQFTRLDALQQVFRGKQFNFDDVAFKTQYAYDSVLQGLNSIFLGLTTDLAWKFGTYGNELQNNLFQNGQPDYSRHKANDLLATNINRGRDHGLKSYIDYVKSCHSIVVNSFKDLKSLMNGPSIQQLESIYESVQDIELYAGGLSELPASDSVAVGKTFACIITRQFSDLKKGDRFYYENSPSVNSAAFTLEIKFPVVMFGKNS